jgi:hypothetical protein
VGRRGGAKEEGAGCSASLLMMSATAAVARQRMVVSFIVSGGCVDLVCSWAMGRGSEW